MNVIRELESYSTGSHDPVALALAELALKEIKEYHQRLSSLLDRPASNAHRRMARELVFKNEEGA